MRDAAAHCDDRAAYVRAGHQREAPPRQGAPGSSEALRKGGQWRARLHPHGRGGSQAAAVSRWRRADPLLAPGLCRQAACPNGPHEEGVDAGRRDHPEKPAFPRAPKGASVRRGDLEGPLGGVGPRHADAHETYPLLCISPAITCLACTSPAPRPAHVTTEREPSSARPHLAPSALRPPSHPPHRSQVP